MRFHSGNTCTTEVYTYIDVKVYYNFILISLLWLFVWVKIEIQQKIRQKTEENSGKQFRKTPLKVIRPNLIISKLEYTNLEWLSFWSQFEIEIDCTDSSKQILIFKVISHPESKSSNWWSSIQHRRIWKSEIYSES